MERPDLQEIGPEKEFRLVATTTNLADANDVAEQYEMKGYQTKITRRMRAGISIYQVWVAKSPYVFQGGAAGRPGGAPRRNAKGPQRGDLPKISKRA